MITFGQGPLAGLRGAQYENSSRHIMVTSIRSSPAALTAHTLNGRRRSLTMSDPVAGRAC